MEDIGGGPALEVGFVFNTAGAFDSLTRFGSAFDTVSANLLSEMAKVENASRNIVSFGGATSAFTMFGHSASKSVREAGMEMQRAERAGEALSRQLERQNTTFGKSRDELMRMKVETAAVAAEENKLGELANRLRGQLATLTDAQQRAADAAARDAQAVRDAGFAYQMFEARVREGTRAMREQATADAQAAAAKADLETRARRLTNSVDPAAAAQDRFNREMQEARTLIGSGAISLDTYAAKLRQEQSALDSASAAIKRNNGASAAHRMAMQGASYQVQDFITQVSMGANPINAFAVQGAQLAGQFSEIEGKAGAVARFFMGPWGLAITGGLLLVGMMTDGLFKGASAAQAKEKAAKDLSSAIDALSESTRAQTQTEWEAQKATLASAAAMRQKALDTRAATLEEIANARAKLAVALADSARPDPSRGQDGGMDIALTQAALLDGKIRALDATLKTQQDELAKTEVSFREAQAVYLGAAINAGLDKASGIARNYQKSLAGINAEFKKTGDVHAYAQARADLERSYNAEKKALDEANKTKRTAADRGAAHAAQLIRSADATDAQIRNTYALADAYGVSGAAALIAEARVKAESQAIKQRANIEASVDRQIRVAVSERVADAAKNLLATQNQVSALQQVNAMVAEGLVPATRAAELVRERIEDLPLLAALEVAQQRGLKAEADRATASLEAQRKAREDLHAAQATEQFNSATAAGNNRLAELREEIQLIGASEAERVRSLTTLRATQEAERFNVGDRAKYIADQVSIAELELQRKLRGDAYNDSLRHQGDLLEALASNASMAAQGMADAFGEAGRSLGDLASTFASYLADQERMRAAREAELALVSQIDKAEVRARREHEIKSLFAARAMTAQVGLYGDMTSAAKGFFKEGSTGYKVLETAEKAFRAVEFALSVRAMAQDAIETVRGIANSGARASADGVAGLAAQAKLPFPANLGAMAATAAALAAIGVMVGGAFGGGKNNLEKPNNGTGTVLGDSAAKSESITRAIDSLKEVDTLTNTYAREMMQSLRSIDSQIGGFATLVVRAGNVNASGGINTGFKQDAVGKTLEGIITGGGLFSKIPVLGGIIGGIGSLVGSLFGTKTSVIGSGLYGGAQSLESILNGGFDASYYSDVKKKKKFFGITTGKSYSTQFSNADAGLENQFTLILREFNTAIAAAAGPLGVATADVQARLNRFVVNIGKIDLQGLTGAEIEEKLTAVFGAAADNMANAAFPGIARFQKVGEGTFETLVRVASIVEAVSASFDQLGFATSAFSIDVKMAVAEQFESASAMTNAVQAYFEAYYTPAEQAAAKTAQFGKVFDSLGVAMPSTLSSFRALVDAQDLTTTAGREIYATLIQLAPAFAELKSAMEGAKSAADILAERQDLERKLLELQGNTAAIRALDLAKLDPSNRALQQQIWAIQDAQEAARAADQLRQAWASVGDGIMEEVKRIRGLTGGNEDGGFAMLMGQFNAATAAARAGDQDAAKSLPGLSQSLLRSAAAAATSRQELDRVQAQTAASLERTYDVISLLAGASNATTASTLAAAATAAQANTPTSSAANEDLAAAVRSLSEKVSKMHEDNNAGHAATASNTGAIQRKLDDVTAASGGDAISTVIAA